VLRQLVPVVLQGLAGSAPAPADGVGLLVLSSRGVVAIILASSTACRSRSPGRRPVPRCSPRRAPGFAAFRRRRRLLVVGVLIVIAGLWRPSARRAAIRHRSQRHARRSPRLLRSRVKAVATAVLALP